MKTIIQRNSLKFLLLAAVLLLLMWGFLHASILSSKVTATWSYDFIRDPICSSAKQKSCIDHFEVKDITNERHLVLIQKVPNPSPAVNKVNNITSVFKYGPPFGNRVICVIAVGFDSNGKEVTSNPYAARVSVFIRPRASLAVAF
jgi:hypothetical protein